MECHTVGGERDAPDVEGCAKRRGFTLIELLVVMGVIGLLLALALPRYFKSLEHAKDVALAENLKVMRTQIDRFYADRGRYPETLHELVDARYLRDVPMDPITQSREGARAHRRADRRYSFVVAATADQAGQLRSRGRRIRESREVQRLGIHLSCGRADRDRNGRGG